MKLLYRFVNYFGLLYGVRLFWKVLTGRTARMQLPGYTKSFSLRKGTTDIQMFYQLFFNQCYKLNYGFIPQSIIDAGANTGLASLFYNHEFPDATIVAIEPETNNFQTLQNNVAGLSNVITLQVALWHQNAKVFVLDAGKGESGFSVSESGNGSSVPSMTVSELMKTYNFDAVDILKMDIEGSEREVFSKGYEDWLPRTRCLIVELHDETHKGASMALIHAISHYNFRIVPSGENLVFFNNDRVT